MRKAFVVVVVTAVSFLASYRTVSSHCEIPCGIYGDRLRIELLNEDILTVEKSMQQIVALSKESPVNMNQVVRWVTNKDEHCRKIQDLVTQYFMTQRVKPAPETDAMAYKKYLKQITALHSMLVFAMKAKQTTDLENVTKLKGLVGEFSEAYFSPEDLQHLKEHQEKK